MRFILTVLLVFMLVCWLCCLIYMMAREKNLQTAVLDLKHKWFYLVLFIVLTVFIGGMFYVLYFGGVL
jgi:hypothetical protein